MYFSAHNILPQASRGLRPAAPPPGLPSCCVLLAAAFQGLSPGCSLNCHLPLPELQARQDRNQSLRSPDSSEHCKWVLFSSFQHKGGNQELGCFLPTTHCCARKGRGKGKQNCRKIPYHSTILAFSWLGIHLVAVDYGWISRGPIRLFLVCSCMYLQCFRGGSTGLELPSWTSSISAFWWQFNTFTFSYL